MTYFISRSQRIVSLAEILEQLLEPNIPRQWLVIHSGCLVVQSDCPVICSGYLVICSGCLVMYSGCQVICSGRLIVCSGCPVVCSGSLVTTSSCLVVCSVWEATGTRCWSCPFLSPRLLCRCCCPSVNWCGLRTFLLCGLAPNQPHLITCVSWKEARELQFMLFSPLCTEKESDWSQMG